MNQRLLSVFVFAIVVAGLASLLVYRFVAQHLQSAAPVVTTTLLVADHDLELGALIGEADLKPAAWNGPIPALALVKTEDAVGRGVITKIYKNEPILSETAGSERGRSGPCRNHFPSECGQSLCGSMTLSG